MTCVRRMIGGPQAVATVIAVCMCSQLPDARAQTAIKGDKAAAEAHQKAAFRAINSGDLDTGLIELEAAYLDYPDPKFLYNIAVAQEQKPNNCRPAHKAYEHFLDKCDGCRTESLARSRLERLLNRCVVSLTVKTVPAGASVTIDGKPEDGVTPLIAKVWAGERRVVATLDGYAAEEQVAAVLQDTPRDLVMQLVPAGLAIGDASTVSPSAQLAAAAADERGIPSWAIWTTATAAAVAGGIGIGLGVAAQSEADSINSNPNLRPSTRAEDGDGAQNMATIANVAYGVAGAAAIATVVMLLWPELGDGDDSSSPKTAQPGAVSFTW